MIIEYICETEGVIVTTGTEVIVLTGTSAGQKSYSNNCDICGTQEVIVITRNSVRPRAHRDVTTLPEGGKS